MQPMTRLRRALQQDDGFSLVELLVVMTLFLIVGGVVGTGVVAGQRVTVQTEQRITALTDVQKGVERLTRNVRTSDAREVTSPRSPLVHASAGRVVADVVFVDDVTPANSTRTRHHYFLDTAGATVRLCHRQETFALGAAAAYVAASSCDEVLVDDLRGTGATAAFEFRNAAGTCVAGCVSGGVVDTTAATPAQLETIHRVVVTLRRGIPGAQPLSLTTSVTLRNKVG